jgi:hypothetical protein
MTARERADAIWLRGTNAWHDGLNEVTDAGRHKGITEVQMAGMRPALHPVTQSCNGSSHLGGGGNIAGTRIRAIQR